MAMVEDMRPLSITPVGHREQSDAAEILRRFSEQDLTLTDAVGLFVMKDRDVRSCWSTDFHLGLTGVPLVIDEH
jgi:predicted nucleic acid-binding protein